MFIHPYTQKHTPHHAPLLSSTHCADHPPPHFKHTVQKHIHFYFHPLMQDLLLMHPTQD